MCMQSMQVMLILKIWISNCSLTDLTDSPAFLLLFDDYSYLWRLTVIVRTHWCFS